MTRSTLFIVRNVLVLCAGTPWHHRADFLENLKVVRAENGGTLAGLSVDDVSRRVIRLIQQVGGGDGAAVSGDVRVIAKEQSLHLPVC